MTYHSNSDRKQKTESLSKELQAAVLHLRQTKDCREFLRLMASLPSYSFNNLLLIAYQKPSATMVMGYRAWQKFGRHVKAGEHGIRIFAPMAGRKKTADKDKKDDEEEQALSPEEKEEHYFHGFRVVSVFDVSQTEGKELPDLACSSAGFKGDYPHFDATIEKIRSLNPETSVTFVERETDANGWFSPHENSISVCSDMSQTETIRTLIHEEAHSRLHCYGGDEEEAGTDVKECEAEGVSYVVCQMLGIDTTGYAVPYITAWMYQADDKELQAAMRVIQKTAQDFAEKLQK